MEDLKRDDLNPDTNERNEEAFSYFKNFTRMSPEDFDYLQEAIAQSGSKNVKQGNRGDMRKIHVTRQFFEASGPQGHFFEKTKKPFLDEVYGSMCTKCQVCLSFRQEA